jgi:outer membrane receptor protein involved in Fe transport
MKRTTADAGLRPRVCGLSLAIAELTQNRRAAAGGALLASALAIVPVGSVAAQDQQDDQVLEEVVVTGSRIVRQDFTANSPIQTVDETLFDETSAVGVETVLNRLPQFVPAVTQFSTGDVQQTVTNTVGASTVSLRGLGPNRNLVLINGQRAMPIDPRMVVDTNTIPAAAIQRVEVISGGASAVYGADAVGGVVNFILKDNYEGANIDVRFGDTQHGGDQTVSISALFGANVADDRGNVMLQVSRDTRSKEHQWQRDWRLEDYANPNTNGGGFVFGSATWYTNEWTSEAPNPNFQANQAASANNPRLIPNQFIANPNYVPGSTVSASNPTVVRNDPTQDAVNALFPAGACPNPLTPPPAGLNGCQIPANLSTSRFSSNRDGTLFTGLAAPSSMSPGAYKFNGPVYNHPTNPRGGDLDGAFPGMPIFVMQPNGQIKENTLYQWASIPLERLSAFANGHFDVSDNVRVTGSAMVSRNKTETSLALTSANINQWGAGVPFGNEIYRGGTSTFQDIPDSLIDVNGNGIADAGDQTNGAYTLGGRFGVNCDAPVGTPGMPWADGLPGCTASEAWPTSPDIYNLMISRGGAVGTMPGLNGTLMGVGGNELLWASREPDWMRNALGAGRSTTTETTVMSYTLGLEGDFPSGDHSWDMTIYTGRADNTVNQLGSMRLSSYRAVAGSPNWGRNMSYDSNPWESSGFAESVPTCTSGLPIVDNRAVTQDCLQMISPALKNLREMTQTIFEANLVGDLAEMRAGPLQYAAGYTYRENGFTWTLDNLSDINNITDPIGGLFPGENSQGEFDVSEIYGELLVPIVQDGPIGVEHFNLEIGARVSDWSMENMPNLNTYKALIDWAVSPRYRIRGGFNRAFRAPNLGELYSRRAQLFGAGGATRDWCSENLANAGTFSATPPTGPGTTPTAQNIQSETICRALMGPSGALDYYDNRARTEQPTAGGLGIALTSGNEALREEQADTWTIGVAMEILEDWRLTVDWYRIQLENMIATEGLDGIYQRCLDINFNPTGSPTAGSCNVITRNPSNGNPATVDRSFTNEGAADFSGVDLSLNWSHQLEAGGGLNLNLSANAPIEEITQDRPDLAPVDWAGYNACALGLQCQNYEYRLFTSVGYNRGSWGFNVRHQYWPELKSNQCRSNPPTAASVVGCENSTLPDYSLFAATANYRFADKYNLAVGIENLLDEEPPCVGANPLATPFPTDCTRTGDGSTYDPLGRRFFVQMTMDF